MNKILAILVVVVVVVAGAAAVLVMNNGNSDDNNKDKSITITDLDGKTYTFDKPLEHVVLGYSTSGGPFTTMAAILGDDLASYLVGIDNSLYTYRTDIYQAFCDQVPGFKDLEQVGGVGAGFDVSHVALLGTQAFITAIHHKSVVEANGVDTAFAKLGIPTIYVDFVSEDLDKSVQSIKMLGTLFGKEDRANEIASYYSGKVTAVTNKVSELLKNNTISRTTIYIEAAQYGATQFGKSQGDNYLFGKIANLCGANSICSSDQATLESSYVLSKDPSVIFLQGSDWGSSYNYLNLGFNGTESKAQSVITEIFENRSGWSDLTAYKDGKVYSLNMGLSRDVWDFVAFEYFVTSMYPDYFDYDADKDLKSFFDKYMPVKYSGTWFYNYQTSS